MCPGIAPAYNDNEGACPNLTSVKSSDTWNPVHSSYPWNDNDFLGVRIENGAVRAALTRNALYQAFCK